jgi:chromate reductase, NAD(P)H dehydrogenase (quinone)
MDRTIRILGFAGSLRAGSFNRKLLDASRGLLPQGAELDIFDLRGIPLFNQDQESDPPARVMEFKDSIRGSDALLIVTPEYNYSVPGVLKNAIDWASRPYGDNVFNEKPVAIMGASTGILGTARAQYHLRQVCVFLNTHPLNRPEVMVSRAHEKFTSEGELSDDTARALIRELLAGLADWAGKLRGARDPGTLNGARH